MDSASISHVFNSYIEKRKINVSQEMFRKIISYCRKLEPKLKPELLDYLKPLYVNLRKMADRDKANAIPINLRNIEALIRLSEAHAKLRMSEYVEEQDFEQARKIFMFCLKQVGIENDSGMVDMSRLTEKVPTSHRGRITKLLEILQGIKSPNNEILEAHVYDACEKVGIEKYEVTTFLNELKQKGELIEKVRGVYRML
jgi:replicative DNA helicase Mcm